MKKSEKNIVQKSPFNINRAEYTIVLPDTHFNVHDPKAINICYEVIKDLKPKRIIQIGDLLDFAAIARFRLSEPDPPKVFEEIKSGNEFWDSIQRNCPNSEKFQLGGNHCARLSKKIINDYPALKELEVLKLENLLNLEKRRIKYIPYGSKEQAAFEINGIHIHHGIYSSMNHAQDHLRSDFRPQIYGHVHDHQVAYSKGYKDDTRIFAMSIGCLCKTDMSYLEGRTTKWILGFASILKYNNKIQAEFHRIQNNSIIFRDSLYKVS